MSKTNKTILAVHQVVTVQAFLASARSKLNINVSRYLVSKLLMMFSISIFNSRTSSFNSSMRGTMFEFCALLTVWRQSYSTAANLKLVILKEGWRTMSIAMSKLLTSMAFRRALYPFAARSTDEDTCKSCFTASASPALMQASNSWLWSYVSGDLSIISSSNLDHSPYEVLC